MSESRLKATLSGYLPRILERARLLPESDDVRQGIGMIEFALEQWPTWPTQKRRNMVLGIAVLMGEIEHRARLDALIESGRRRKADAAKGGMSKAVPDWHRKCVNYARSLLATGTEIHNLASILAAKFKRNRKTVDTVLKKAGVK